jgi:hypothetical protein
VDGQSLIQWPESVPCEDVQAGPVTDSLAAVLAAIETKAQVNCDESTRTAVIAAAGHTGDHVFNSGGR